jgi:prepilin-type N-terminal cleavage/methylation domain-containing protein
MRIACRRRHTTNGERGFSLLELVIAVTLLAAFVLPVLQILSESRVRAIRYTQLRTVKALAQRKLHDHIHYVEDALDRDGTFEEEGYPSWTWQIAEPELRSQSEQIVLDYTITVWVPLPIYGDKDGESSYSADEGSTYDYNVWTLPSKAWLDEQADLFYSQQPSILYGDPAFEGYGGMYPGMGTAGAGAGAAGGAYR